MKWVLYEIHGFLDLITVVIAMKRIKKWMVLTTLLAMVSTSGQGAFAREYYTDAGGCAYEEAYQSCCYAPAIAFAIAAIAAVIAVGVHNRGKNGHAHSE